jgi:hypothetical protein
MTGPGLGRSAKRQPSGGLLPLSLVSCLARSRRSPLSEPANASEVSGEARGLDSQRRGGESTEPNQRSS